MGPPTLAGTPNSARDSEFFRHMVTRGLQQPTTVTSDGAPGLIYAINPVFGKSIRVRCWYHKLGNIRTKPPDDAAPEVLAEVRAIRDTAPLEAVSAQADRVVNRYRGSSQRQRRASKTTSRRY